jgi:hypothetical protein
MDRPRNLTAAARSSRICVQRFGGPRDMRRGVVWSLIGLALIAAFQCVFAQIFATGAMILAVPLLLVALCLVIVGGLCAVSAPLAWLSARVARFRPGSLRIDNGLVLDEDGSRTVTPLVLVADARMSPGEDELAIHTRDGDVIRVKVSGRDEGLSIVAALAESKVHGTWLSSLYEREGAAWWVSWPWVSSLAASLCALIVTLPFAQPELALALAALVGGGVRIAAVAARKPGVVGSLVVGKDGVAMKQGQIDRFIAFASIDRVDETPGGASLRLTSGEVVAIDILPAPRVEGEPLGSLTADLLASRQARLLALLREGLLPDGPEVVRAGALLERRGRTVRAWRDALSELVREAAGGYRTATLPKEQALAVLEDGHASGELRIGAALALTSGGQAGHHAAPRGLDPDTVLRLRVAVETCVNQDVRTALRDAIYGDLDEETLERALRSNRAAR